MKLWLSRISRQTPDGKPWQPTQNDKVCSEHFLPTDFNTGFGYKTLIPTAVPSVFTAYPVHKQCPSEKKRPSPRKRNRAATCTSDCPDNAGEIPLDKRVKIDHNYCCPTVEEDLSRTKQKLSDMKEKLAEKSKKVISLSAKLKRRDCHISSLLDEVHKLRLLQEEEVNLLKENFSEETLALIENEVKAGGKSKYAHQYSDQLKSFAVTLHYYSAAAYEFLRKYLHLPHSDSIRRWASSQNVQPGFLAGVMSFLKERLESDPDMKDVTIMYDAMSIRKELIYDHKQQTYAGYINHGHLQTAAADTLASEALVFLVVGLKRSFKYPIAYFLIDKISALQQAQIVKQSISALSEVGFEVHSVVCDGAYTNQATASHLGCQMNTDDMKTTFEHPHDAAKSVQYLFDAAHLIKVVRNCLADTKLLKGSTGQLIKWQYVVELHQLQVQHTLYLGNKLKGKHIDYARNKMNVRLAAQTLSASVADAIEYCREELSLPQFAGSEETCTFLRWFDAIFDLCNSNNCLGKGTKSALNKANFERKAQFVHDACEYINSLKDCDGKPLVKGKRKTGFIGFMVTMRAIIAIGQELLFSKNYSFFLTYKLSQDHLETLFSKIRRKGGNNNNPNALQFKWALRALLQKNGVTESHRGNCISLPEVNNTLFTESSSADATPLPVESSPIPQLSSNVESPEAQLTKMLLNPGVYHDHVLHYIAGFICRKLKEKIVCADCCAFLSTGNESNGDATLTRKKSRGGLTFVSNDFLQVVKAADRCLRRLLATAKEGPLSSVSSMTTRLVTLEVIDSHRAKVFFDLNLHCREHHRIADDDDHVTQIMKEICALFCKIILSQHGRLYTDRFIHKNQGSVRHKLTKTILFLHL